jgi:hypothetical protein
MRARLRHETSVLWLTSLTSPLAGPGHLYKVLCASTLGMISALILLPEHRERNLTSDGDGLEIVARLVSLPPRRDPFDSPEFGRIEHGVLSMSTRTCVVGPKSVSKNCIVGFEGGEFMPDTLNDIPFTKECVVALIFVRNREWSEDDDGDEVMSDGDGGAARDTWSGQALVLVDTEGEEDDDDDNGDNNHGGERKFRRCGLLCVPEKALDLFGEEEVVLDIV